MDFVTAFRLVAAAAWSVLLWHRLPSVLCVIKGRAGEGDMRYLIEALFAVLIIGFSIRWLTIPDSVTAHAVLYVLSAAIAVFALVLDRVAPHDHHE